MDMKPVSQDKTHCFKHACTHPAREMCQYCELDSLRIAFKPLPPNTAVDPEKRKSSLPESAPQHNAAASAPNAAPQEPNKQQIDAAADSMAHGNVEPAAAAPNDRLDAARYRFRHSTYVDKDGYEYGYCKVRWKNGAVDSMLWADDAEIDAAMLAAAAPNAAPQGEGSEVETTALRVAPAVAASSEAPTPRTRELRATARISSMRELLIAELLDSHERMERELAGWKKSCWLAEDEANKLRRELNEARGTGKLTAGEK